MNQLEHMASLAVRGYWNNRGALLPREFRVYKLHANSLPSVERILRMRAVKEAVSRASRADGKFLFSHLL